MAHSNTVEVNDRIGEWIEVDYSDTLQARTISDQIYSGNTNSSAGPYEVYMTRTFVDRHDIPTYRFTEFGDGTARHWVWKDMSMKPYDQA